MTVDMNLSMSLHNYIQNIIYIDIFFSKITSEKILEMIQDLKSMIENQSPAYNRENTVGTQVSESPAQIDHAKTFA